MSVAITAASQGTFTGTWWHQSSAGLDIVHNIMPVLTRTQPCMSMALVQQVLLC